MPKNQRGGKKFKRGKKLGEDTANKNVELAEGAQEYAKVIARLGGARIEVECTDGKKRQAIIPGKFKKKIWLNPGDIVLVSVDAIGDDNVCSVDKKYNLKDIVTLRQKGLINFEEDEVESKKYEFKSTEDNIGRVHPNVKEQAPLPSLDSDESDDSIDLSHYLNKNKSIPAEHEELNECHEQEKNEESESSESSESSDDENERKYTIDDL